MGFDSLLLAICIILHVRDASGVYTVSSAILGSSNNACPSSEVLRMAREDIKSEIKAALRNSELQTVCPCGGPGKWRSIAYLNTSDPNQECPQNWTRTFARNAPVVGCGRSRESAGTCDSAVYPSKGQLYSQVCGRVNAYQVGSPNAFNNSVSSNRTTTLEDPYIDGISLTHGAAGARQHIWSFAAAVYESDTQYMSEWNCACTNSNESWPFQNTFPSFIGSNYFCATGNRGPGSSNTQFYAEDPLWDGVGCGPMNSCCQLNNPPWFCTTLPRPTTDDIELRICHDQDDDNENVVVSLIEIAVK